MTAAEFIKGYCERSGVTWALLREYRVVVKCECGDEICEGFAMVPRSSVVEDKYFAEVKHRVVKQTRWPT